MLKISLYLSDGAHGANLVQVFTLIIAVTSSYKVLDKPPHFLTTTYTTPLTILTKIILIHLKCKITYVALSNCKSFLYCDINSCHSFSILKATMKSKVKLIALAFKSEKEL